MRAILAAAAFLWLTACGSQENAPVSVEQAWVRLPAVKGQPGSGYFRASASENDTLVGVTAPRPTRVELHESTEAGGMASMRPLRSVAIPAGGTILFAPGGKHLMVYDIDPALRPGDTLPLFFGFEKQGPIRADARIVAAGDPAP